MRKVRGFQAVVSKSKRQQYLAVEQCLSRCYATDFPITCLAQFCAELRQKGWSMDDVHEVETAVRRILAGVMGRERDSLTEMQSNGWMDGQFPSGAGQPSIS
jgi:hypothetical protein